MKNAPTIAKKYVALVLPFLFKNKKSLASTLATLLLIGVDTCVVAAIPWIWGELISHYDASYGSYAWVLTGALATCWLLNKTVSKLGNIIFYYVINQAVRSIRLRLVTHFHHISSHGEEVYEPSEVLSASTRVSTSVRFCLQTLFLGLLPVLLKLGSLSLSMYTTFDKSSYFLVAIFICYIYAYVSIRRFMPVRREVWERSDKVMVAMGDSLRQKGFAKLHPNEEKNRLVKLFDKELQGWWKENVARNKVQLIQNILFFILGGAFFSYLIWLLRGGQMEIKQVIKLQGYIFMVHRQVYNLTEYGRRFAGSLADMEKVLVMLDLHTYEEEGRGTKQVKLHANTPVLQLEKVHFSYPCSKKPILKETSLTIKKGEKIAIAGKSGSGKSTLARLMAGIYVPTKGNVIFKGVSTRLLEPAFIGKHIYFLGQNTPLIAGSVRDNMMTNGKEEELSPLSYLKEVIDKDHSNQQLSGGEQQRVLLARCLSYTPEVVLLDEAFSYLDQKNAQALLNMTLQKVPTVILMTHRKELFKKMDKIYHLENGVLKA